MLTEIPIAVEETAMLFVKFSHRRMKRKGKIKKKGFEKYFLIISMLYENFGLLENQRNVNILIPVFVCEENAELHSINLFYFSSFPHEKKIHYLFTLDKMCLFS